MSNSASTSSAATLSSSSNETLSSPPSPTSSTSSLPSNGFYDPEEPFQAPLGSELGREPSIDGTSIGAGSAYGGSSDLGSDGLRKSKLEDIDQDERAVSDYLAMTLYRVLFQSDDYRSCWVFVIFRFLGGPSNKVGSEYAIQ